MERYAPRYDAVAFTFVEMLAAFVGFAVIAVALGQVEVPRGWTVWGALIVTGVFASALGFLVQTWAQRQLVGRAHRARVRDGAGLDGDLRLLARGRPPRRSRLDGRADHGRHRRRRARGGGRAPPTAAPMTAVVLALASAALFGAMTVAVRLGVLRTNDAKLGAAVTASSRSALLSSRRRSARGRSTRTTSRSSRSPASSARRVAAPLHARGPRRRAGARVGRRRRGADRHGRARPARPRRAARARAPRRRRAHRRRTARSRGERVRPELQADRDGVGDRLHAHLREPRHLRPLVLRRDARRVDRGRRRDARRRLARARPRRTPLALAPRAPVRPGRVCFGLSYVFLFEAYYRGRVTSSRRSSRPSRSGASPSPRS